jgi:hypothetical protein
MAWYSISVNGQNRVGVLNNSGNTVDYSFVADYPGTYNITILADDGWEYASFPVSGYGNYTRETCMINVPKPVTVTPATIAIVIAVIAVIIAILLMVVVYRMKKDQSMKPPSDTRPERRLFSPTSNLNKKNPPIYLKEKNPSFSTEKELHPSSFDIDPTLSTEETHPASFNIKGKNPSVNTEEEYLNLPNPNTYLAGGSFNVEDNFPGLNIKTILSEGKIIWEPFDLALELGFGNDPERFYSFIKELNDDTIRFHSDKILVDVDASSSKKEDIIRRFQAFSIKED